MEAVFQAAKVKGIEFSVEGQGQQGSSDGLYVIWQWLSQLFCARVQSLGKVDPTVSITGRDTRFFGVSIQQRL